MNNRFGHMKNRKKNLEEFIEGANTPIEKSDTKPSKNTQKQKEKILLSISSKMNRDEECGKPVLLYLKKDIAEEIDKHCHGNKQAILNYLLKRGVTSIIENNELILM